MHVLNSNIKFTFYLSTRFLNIEYEHRFLSKFSYLDFISVKYYNQETLEWLFQNLRAKYVSKSVGWNLSDGRNAREHSTFINPSNSVFKVNIPLKLCWKNAQSIQRTLVIDLQ